MEFWQWILIAGGCVLSGVVGYIFAMVRLKPTIQGVIRLAYDIDNPDHPAMGLMLENMDYILSHKTITLAIEKRNFPE